MRLEFSPEARRDLFELSALIAADGGAQRALAYIDRLERRCAVLLTFPQAGTSRGDLRRGLRVLGFERRVVIAYVVRADRVVVQRVLYGGRVPVAG